jgi:AcrR family transcriptional regulator
VTGPGAARHRSARGRRPGGEDTRAGILDAAKAAFGERGYEGATVRDVARRAGVDAALVHHYFGTKQRLFLAAMEFPVDVATVVPRVLAGGEAGVGERFVAFVVDLWDRPEVRPTILAVVRSATTDPVAADMLRAILTEGPLRALATAIDRPDADARVALAGSQLVGLAMARYVVRLEPLASMPPHEVAAAVGPVVERYLYGPREEAPER